MAFLEVSGVGMQEEGHTALQNITFRQPQFHRIAIAGETGSGKSSLLQIIAGLVQPTSGQVYFENNRVRRPQEVLVPGQPGIAYLSQEFALPQFLRVEQVLKYASTYPEKDAQKLFKLCRINHLLLRKTKALSGGERQRIALAKLLLASPKLLLLDEPFSNLDASHKTILKAVIHNLSEKLQITCILVSHDPLDTLSWADEILVLKAGKLVQKGTPALIYRQPKNQYVAGLFGTYNLIPASAASEFYDLTGLQPAKKKLLIRPENFSFVQSPEKGIPGKISAVMFFGSYYETAVQLSEITVTVKTVFNPGKNDDPVYISVAAEAICLI